VEDLEKIKQRNARALVRLNFTRYNLSMRVPNYPGSRGVSINLTPMIDVTFLLIIFFLVSSHLAKQENFLPLELPMAASGISDFSDRTTLTIQIPSDGTYMVNSAKVPLDQVGNAILAKMEENGRNPIRIRIRTDKSASYAPIAKLLKVCAVTGNSDIVFAVYEDER
jgi:biopolymer transport protein ExbD